MYQSTWRHVMEYERCRFVMTAVLQDVVTWTQINAFSRQECTAAALPRSARAGCRPLPAYCPPSLAAGRIIKKIKEDVEDHSICYLFKYYTTELKHLKNGCIWLMLLWMVHYLVGFIVQSLSINSKASFSSLQEIWSLCHALPCHALDAGPGTGGDHYLLFVSAADEVKWRWPTWRSDLLSRQRAFGSLDKAMLDLNWRFSRVFLICGASNFKHVD